MLDEIVTVGWAKRRAAELARAATLVCLPSGVLEYADAPGNDPVLVLHGTPGGHDQAGAVARTLELSSHRVICPSRPGYLRTPLSTGTTFAQQADAMCDLLDHLDIDDVAVLAFSGGGPCALEFALRHRGRCRTLVTLCAVTQRAAPASPTWTSRLQSALVQRDLATNTAARLALRSPRRLVTLAFRSKQDRLAVKSDPEKLSLLGDLVASNALSSLRKAGRDNDRLQEQTLRAIPFADIDIPVLAFHGTADHNVSYQDAVALTTAAPSARLVTFEESDHLFLLPHRERVVEELTAHLAATS